MRAGIEKLNKSYKDIVKLWDKSKIKLSVCFIDINGLKELNDLLGHEVGDELILSIVS
ncbi:MAG: diguanylate cyclase domain-containing protein [Lachnotalea sp.]